MTTRTAPRPSPDNAPDTRQAGPEGQQRSMLGRVMSLTRGELKMLLRNRTAIVNVVLLPLLMLGALAASGGLRGNELQLGNALFVSGVVIAIAYVIYYNLVTTYAARREAYVLKRLRTGPVSDLGVITATSVPSVLLALLQIVVVIIALAALGKTPSLTNIVAVLLAIVLGVLAFVGLALMSTGFTKTAETAQITTLPVVMITMGLSGMFFPLHALPTALFHIAYLTPGAAMVELLNLGLAGINRYGDQVSGGELWISMLMPTAVLLVWTALGAYYLRRSFRWEPRR